MALEFIERGYIADGAVEALVVIMFDEAGYDAAGVCQGQGSLGADTGAFNGFMIAFEFAVALGVIG